MTEDIIPDDLTFQATAPATLPTGTVVATDLVDARHFQLVKLDQGTNGVSTPVTDLATGAGQTAGNVLSGAVDETAPATDTASSGLNGRLQRIAQRITSAITLLAGGLPAALGSGGGLKVDGSGTALPVSVATVPSHAVTNAGVFATQIDGAALTALQLIDDTVLVDDAAYTPAVSKLTVSGLFADETGTDSVDEGDVGSARMTLDRKAIVTPQPHTAGGLSIHRSIDLDEGTLEVVKGSPGCVYGMWVTNTATTTRWIKFYNATSGTYGTGTPVITIGIPGNVSDDISANFGPGGMGVQFSTGISVGAGTGVLDNDTGAPAANDLIVNIYFI